MAKGTASPFEQPARPRDLDAAREPRRFGGADSSTERREAIEPRLASTCRRVARRDRLGDVSSRSHLFQGAVQHAGPQVDASFRPLQDLRGNGEAVKILAGQ